MNLLDWLAFFMLDRGFAQTWAINRVVNWLCQDAEEDADEH